MERTRRELRTDVDLAPQHLLPLLIDRFKDGSSLRDLIAAAARANGRIGAGEDGEDDCP